MASGETSQLRAALPVQRPPKPAQQARLEKREKKQAAIVAGETVDKATAYIETFDRLCMAGGVTPHNQQRILETAFQWADRGIAAFDGLTELQRQDPQGRNAFVTLYQKRAALAAFLVQHLPEVPVEQGHALSQRMLEARSQPVDLVALDRDLNAHLGQVDQVIEAIRPYITATSEAIEKLGTPAHLKAHPGLVGVLKEATHTLTKLRMQAFDMHKEKIWTLGNRMVVAEGMDGIEILREIVALLSCAVDLSDRAAIDLLQDARIPMRGDTAAHAGRMQNGALRLRGHAQAFILLASRHFDTEAGASQAVALDFAKRLAKSIGALAQECDAVLDGHKVSVATANRLEGTTYLGVPTRPSNWAPPDDEAPMAPGPYDLVASPSTPAPRRSYAGKARKAPAGGHVPPDGIGGPAAVALSLRQTVVLELAQERLKAFPAPKAGRLREPGDVLALGASLRKDTVTIGAAIGQNNDPLNLARQIRFTLDGWFGDPGQWKVRRQQLAEAGAEGSTLVLDTLRALDQRIEAIDAMHRSVHAMGTDLIKTFPYPELKHVSHLLQQGVAADGGMLRIGAPRKLRSLGDPDDRHGTLFEVRLDTGTLADGRPAPALYVHLHTKVPITAEACRTVEFDGLDAFHVKTADQSGKGATWELLNDALHSVHRGVLDAEVLKALQHRMASP
ncbi:hypothetical protein AVHY2522_22520 [Acidovorax sp. SUPP2522]|uniref:hypothetical protein n=1 Tax=unclassified Acidovorax TaxID=2684926 RepID=UPI002349F9B9|nr:MULTISPECIES: hypothetical protein [unclassified Acidovorax]WCM97283.1 hypothetical protein M5C96_23315 [Acidovorax sp. GBBC 1281]GKT19459.1 hypothetical protein AVHY2522_22520 [Acidovorax sp. SUPP2522]